MSDYVPSTDRSQWPAEAVGLAEWAQLPEHALFYRVVDWPVEDPWGDEIKLPKLPRGQQSYRWMPVKIFTGPGRGDKCWIFAQRWPERERVIKAGKDVRDVTLSTAADPAEAVA